MRGFLQVYTGDGKGKTTAALGLALRAAGAGLKVFIGQFIKMDDYSEIKALERFPDLVRVEMVITGCSAAPRIIDAADLVTEMKEVKHYFEKGVRARIGIEK